METEKTKRIVARCDARLKKKIERTQQLTGISESELVRAAVKHFFAKNITVAEVLRANIDSRFLN